MSCWESARTSPTGSWPRTRSALPRLITGACSRPARTRWSRSARMGRSPTLTPPLSRRPGTGGPNCWGPTSVATSPSRIGPGPGTRACSGTEPCATIPLELRHRGGTTMPVLYNASVYRDPSGEVGGVFAAARDVTEIKRTQDALTESEGRLRALIDTAPVGIDDLGLDGEIIQANDYFCRSHRLHRRRTASPCGSRTSLIPTTSAPTWPARSGCARGRPQLLDAQTVHQ